jgi:hypothetical protein
MNADYLPTILQPWVYTMRMHDALEEHTSIVDPNLDNSFQQSLFSLQQYL